ncbi:MAG: hypothetical protein E7299_04945 [Lachnospiraceae bacterium]|nr:hypothetical protein [Lachnospiraceae bacterium]
MYVTGVVEKTESGSGKTRLQILLDGEDKAELLRRKEIGMVGMWLDDGRLISALQRKKIYASIRDVSNHTGYSPEETKEVLKFLYVERTGRNAFSLADCTMDTAREFINFMIDICLENGIILTDSLYDRTEDIEYMLKSCLKNRRCSICGRKGEVHHWDAIGMGNDRRHYDDSSNRKICLCRKHHTLAHSYGRERFMQIYHVFGVYYMDGSQDVSIEENKEGGKEHEC